MVRLIIEVGDCVKLRSGGQVMTAEFIEGEDVVCVWHDRDGRIRRERMPCRVLTISRGGFDKIGDLLIEGVTHRREEIASYLESAH